MKKIIRSLKSVIQKSVHIAMVSFVLVLPLGYYPDSSGTGDFALGVYGGGGEVASVVHGCGGSNIESSSFREFSGLAEWKFKSSSEAVYSVGMRGGYWEAPKGKYALSFTSSSPEMKIDFSYVNPYFSFDTKGAGVGFGYIFGDVPLEFHPPSSEVHFSGHLRFGNIEKFHLLTSFAENTPLVAGGGHLNLGVGYPIGKVRLYSGFTGGFYDGPGIIQEAGFKLGPRLNGQIAVRGGGLGDKLEWSAAGGLVYRIGR